jgi:large subunit ribosomal protein L28
MARFFAILLATCFLMVAQALTLTMRTRVCDLIGKKANRQAMAVSFSHKRTKKVQHVNLQTKRLWWAEGNKFVTLRVSTKVI